MQNRQEQIRKKGFDMLKAPTSAVDSYAKLKIGTQKFDNAVIDLRYYDKLEQVPSFKEMMNKYKQQAKRVLSIESNN